MSLLFRAVQPRFLDSLLEDPELLFDMCLHSLLEAAIFDDELLSERSQLAPAPVIAPSLADQDPLAEIVLEPVQHVQGLHIGEAHLPCGPVDGLVLLDSLKYGQNPGAHEGLAPVVDDIDLRPDLHGRYL